MDFTEIMNFCGYDLEKANEMAKRYPPVTYPPELIAEALEESCVD